LTSPRSLEATAEREQLGGLPQPPIDRRRRHVDAAPRVATRLGEPARLLGTPQRGARRKRRSIASGDISAIGLKLLECVNVGQILWPPGEPRYRDQPLARHRP
jgi:hypothetical protein